METNINWKTEPVTEIKNIAKTGDFVLVVEQFLTKEKRRQQVFRKFKSNNDTYYEYKFFNLYQLELGEDYAGLADTVGDVVHDISDSDDKDLAVFGEQVFEHNSYQDTYFRIEKWAVLENNEGFGFVL